MESINCKTRNIFQLTTSHRGRPAALAAFFSASYFNSLPHTEVDFTLKLIFPPIYISTHYLTQRQTKQHCTCTLCNRKFQLTTSHRGRHQRIQLSVIDFKISTHYLTQRQTPVSNTSTIIYIFQLTTSHRGRPDNHSAWMPHGHFNSLPHTEVDGQ